MHLFTLIVFLVCFCNSLFAQTGSIFVSIASNGKSIDAATVSLLNADSSWVRSDITDEQGKVSFTGVAAGKYLVSASFLGYKTGMQTVEIKEGQAFDCNIELEKESASLAEVAVTAKKPFIEMSLGKTIVNVEGSTTTGAINVLDLMSRLPGVIADQNGNITMRGKSGVLVLVNDKPTYLSGDDLAAYLRGTTANEVSQIELITQPGARYDAAGNTGIINVKFRKNKKVGLNGNVSAGYQPGRYYRRDESFLLNYRKNKLNLLLAVSDFEAIGHADWKQDMYYMDGAGNVTGSNINRSSATERFSHTTLRFAADYDLSEQTTIGVSARGAYHPNKMGAWLNATYKDDVNGATTYTNSDAPEGHIRKELVVNVYATHKFSKEHTLDVNVDALSFSKNADQDFIISRYNEQMQPVGTPERTNSMQKSPISIYSFKIDDACTFKNGLKLETGIKMSQLTMDFDASFHRYDNNEWINDTGRTNHFLYKEHINAAYAALASGFGKKWETRIGLRAEQTSASGLQYIHNDWFTKNYISLFPTAYVNYKPDTNNQLELNYGRRINRPEYRQLNPFVYYSFQNMYSVGNPALMPQYTNNVELKHSYKNTVITTISWSNTTDVIQGFLTVDTNNVSTNKLRNIASNNNVYLNIELNKDITKWWSFNISGTTFYAYFEGIFNNAWKKSEWTGYSFNTSSRFDLGKGWRAEVYGSYTSSGRWSLTSTFKPVIGFDFGMSKKFNDHWTARLFAQDPLYLFALRANDYGVNYRAETSFRNATRRFNFSLTYNFGGEQKDRRERSMDEARRL
ncbi:MAG: TonB-dependent receptor [Flavipsychrobacter sp.]|jgi:hypothetical protein|nr:TonB-dependent receptor [Flavipsychrobacter sp.]